MSVAQPATRSPKASSPPSSVCICSARTTGPPDVHLRRAARPRTVGGAGRPPLRSPASAARADPAPAPTGCLSCLALQQPFQRRFHFSLPAQALVQFQPQPRKVTVAARPSTNPTSWRKSASSMHWSTAAVAEHLDRPTTREDRRCSNRSSAPLVRPNASSARTPRRTRLADHRRSGCASPSQSGPDSTPIDVSNTASALTGPVGKQARARHGVRRGVERIPEAGRHAVGAGLAACSAGSGGRAGCHLSA